MKQELLEAKIEARMIDLLAEKDIFNFKGNPSGLKGYPDRHVFAEEVYNVEIKVGKEHGSYYKQTPTQQWWEETFRLSNGHYVLLTGMKEMEEWVAKRPDFTEINKNRKRIKL